MREEKKESTVSSIKELLGDIDMNNATYITKAKINELESNIAVLDQKIQAEEKNIARKEYIENELPKSRTKLEDLQKGITSISNEISALSSKNDSLNSGIIDLKSKLRFSSRLEANNEIQKNNAMISKIKRDIELASEREKECSVNLASAKTRREELFKQIEGKQESDREAENNNLSELERNKIQLDKKKQNIHSRIVNNRSNCDNIKLKSTELIDIEKKTPG